MMAGGKEALCISTTKFLGPCMIAAAAAVVVSDTNCKPPSLIFIDTPELLLLDYKPTRDDRWISYHMNVEKGRINFLMTIDHVHHGTKCHPIQ